MAQTEKVTTEGITELAKLWGIGTATGIKSICCLNMATPCTAVVGSTFADPADTATHHTDSGLSIVNITTVTPIAAGVDFDHVFTATASKNVAGIHVCNDDDDVCYIECCFAAVIAMENTDTLTIDGTVAIADA
jgi:hypothetical protein